MNYGIEYSVSRLVKFTILAKITLVFSGTVAFRVAERAAFNGKSINSLEKRQPPGRFHATKERRDGENGGPTAGDASAAALGAIKTKRLINKP